MGTGLVIVLIVVAYWVFVAAMLKAKVSIAADPGWSEARAEHPPSQKVADALDESTDVLEQLGYRRGKLLARGGQNTTWVRTFLEHATGDQAFVMVLDGLRTHRVIAFRADLTDGRRIFTQNSETSGMGVTVPGVATALPGIDAPALYRVHKLVILEADGKLAPRDVAAGVEEMVADHAQTMKSLVDQRVMALVPAEKAYRYTTLGAIWHILRFARPWRDIRQWSRRRRAAALLRRASSKP